MGDDLRDLLASMVGEWTGRYRLYLEPGELTSESDTSATVTPVLDGRFTRIAYDWTVDEARQLGEFLVAAPGGDRLTSSWVDTWHNGDAILFCRSVDDGVGVIGQYGPDDDPWRWRTTFELHAGGAELAVTAWNITPAGEEAVATEARYRRVGA